MADQPKTPELWPPLTNIIDTMVHTTCAYCGQSVAGPASILTWWKWQHRLKCHSCDGTSEKKAAKTLTVVGD